jgi:hypothetical protein
MEHAGQGESGYRPLLGTSAWGKRGAKLLERAEESRAAGLRVWESGLAVTKSALMVTSDSWGMTLRRFSCRRGDSFACWQTNRQPEGYEQYLSAVPRVATLADAPVYVRRSKSMTGRRWADEAFEAFWASFPRKVGKLAAKREWDRIRPTPEVVEAMAKALEWQREQWDDPQYIPHPRTWLHQGRWMDEPPVPVQPKREIPKPVQGIAEWVQRRAANE